MPACVQYVVYVDIGRVMTCALFVSQQLYIHECEVSTLSSVEVVKSCMLPPIVLHLKRMEKRCCETPPCSL